MTDYTSETLRALPNTIDHEDFINALEAHADAWEESERVLEAQGLVIEQQESWMASDRRRIEALEAENAQLHGLLLGNGP